MKQVVLPLPSFAFIIGTRAALAAGIGLLVSPKLSAARRQAIGATLLAIGLATTIPAAMLAKRSFRKSARSGNSSIDHDDRLIGATRFARKGDDV